MFTSQPDMVYLRLSYLKQLVLVFVIFIKEKSKNADTCTHAQADLSLIGGSGVWGTF